MYFASHPDYAAHGLSNTANTADGVFRADTVEEYERTTQRMSDGALLASKTIIIPSSLSKSVCTASGTTGADGPISGLPPDGCMFGPPPEGGPGAPSP